MPQLANETRNFSLFDRIASKSKSIVAERVPQSVSQLRQDAGEFWSDSRANSLVQEMAHWRGKGRFEDDSEWLAIGKKHFRFVTDFARYLGRRPQFDAVLEWGPGGGSNLFQLKNIATKLYGVDISPTTLKICEGEIGPATFVPALIDPARPESFKDHVKQNVDLFVTTAVIQHFPDKAYTEAMLCEVNNVLTADAMCLIQTRYGDGQKRIRQKKSLYKHAFLRFTTFGIEEFVNILENANYRTHYVKLEPRTCYAYYFCTKK
ncbi:MAG: class I SAM-dependent methyltransferase [Hyphomicrobiales bacterium]|nr:class I SAM-dependent methyltransferase [Hyphomicrobiales bacterium]